MRKEREALSRAIATKTDLRTWSNRLKSWSDRLKSNAKIGMKLSYHFDDPNSDGIDVSLDELKDELTY